MASDTVLIKVYIPHTSTDISVCGLDFCVEGKLTMPDAESLLDGIAKQLAKERKEAKAHEQQF